MIKYSFPGNYSELVVKWEKRPLALKYWFEKDSFHESREVNGTVFNKDQKVIKQGYSDWGLPTAVQVSMYQANIANLCPHCLITCFIIISCLFKFYIACSSKAEILWSPTFPPTPWKKIMGNLRWWLSW